MSRITVFARKRAECYASITLYPIRSGACAYSHFEVVLEARPGSTRTLPSIRLHTLSLVSTSPYLDRYQRQYIRPTHEAAP